jgi:ABC-2 type transport system permease protein
MGLIGVFTAVYAVQATLRLRSEETGQRSEPVLATGVGRVRWVASHLVFALAGSAFALVVCGLAAGLVHGLRTGDAAGQVPRLLAAALVQLPAVWTVAGITLALFGLAPRLAVASWGVVLVFLLLGEFGALLGLDRWVMDVSPFSHVPKLPGGQVDVVPLLVLAGVAAVLTAAGLVGFRRRDVG